MRNLERIHWRKTAKICSQCHILTSAKRFIGDSDKCVKCDWNEEISKIYKCCPYCRKWLKKEEITGTLCGDCKSIAREKHSIFKNTPKMDRGTRYVCTICNVARSPISYARGTDISKPVCKLCTTQKRIEAEGKFRCSQCGSVYPKSEWRCGRKQLCIRCHEKQKKWTREKHRNFYRKDPEWIEYFREYSRWKYWTKERPVLNEILFLQWTRNMAKPRRHDRGKGWWMVNRAMFADFRKRPQYWYAMCSDVITKLKTAKMSDYEYCRMVNPKLYTDD